MAPERAKPAVPVAHIADRVLVSARTGEGTIGVFLVDPAADGVAVVTEEATNRQIHGELALDGVFVADAGVLGDPMGGADIVTWTLDRPGWACAPCRSACARGRCGRPRSTPPSASSSADRCPPTRAWPCAPPTPTSTPRRCGPPCGRRPGVTEGLPASEEVAIAKWWASEGGHRVVHSTQHLHGGIGSDIDYPLHRTFLWAKQLGDTLGAGSQTLTTLGAELAEAAR